jgi:hypothetical protein
VTPALGKDCSWGEATLVSRQFRRFHAVDLIVRVRNHRMALVGLVGSLRTVEVLRAFTTRG